MDDGHYWQTRHTRRRQVQIKSSSRKKQILLSESSGTRMTRSIASNSTDKSNTLKSCSTLNQNSILNGNFDKRLILSDEYTHLPAPPLSRHSECQMHKWAKKRTRKQVAYCADCNVCLCMQCYKAFHTVVDLRRLKNDILNDRDICFIATTTMQSPLSEMTPI